MDVVHLKLSHQQGPDEDAIKLTLDYLGVPYHTTYDHELLSLVLPAQTGPNNEDESVQVNGFLGVFTLVSRWAHTLPGNPVHAALVMELVDVARFATLEDVEMLLPEGSWLGGMFEASTAADFYLVARLKHAGNVSRFPRLASYAKQDPSCDFDDSSSRWRCTIS